MTQFKKDMLSALVFFVIGVAVLIAIPYTIKDTQITGVGPRTFPYFIGFCITGLSALLGVVTLYKQHKAVKAGLAEKPKTVSPEEKKSRMKNELRAGVSALIMLVYALLFDVIGYFPSTILFITAYLLLFRVKKPLYYVVCYATMVVIWAAFTYFFQLRLP